MHFHAIALHSRFALLSGPGDEPWVHRAPEGARPGTATGILCSGAGARLSWATAAPSRPPREGIRVVGDVLADRVRPDQFFVLLVVLFWLFAPEEREGPQEKEGKEPPHAPRCGVS